MKHPWLFVISLVCLLLSASLLAAPMAYAVTWPADTAWNKALTKNWEPLTDPVRDVSGDYIDFIAHPAQAGGACFYWYYDGTNLFFRMILNGDPTKKGSQMQPFGWNLFVESTGDNYADYTVSIDGTGNADTIHTMYNNTLDNTMDAETGYAQAATQPSFTDANGYINLINGYARSKAIVVNNQTVGYYLDFYVPLSWFSVSGGGGPASLTPVSRVRFAAGTGASGNTINKDLCGLTNSTTLETYYRDVASDVTPSNGGNYGVLLDTRNNANTVNSGTWTTGETVTFSGYGWPPTTSSYYKSTLNIKLLDPNSTVVWNGVVGVSTDGSITNAATWQVSGSLSGVFTVQVEDPLHAGVYVQKDSFSVVSQPDLSTSDLSVNKATALIGDTLTYQITVVNTGGLPTIPTVTASIPVGTTYVLASTTLDGVPLGDQSGVTPLISGYTLSALGPNQSATLRFQVTVSNGHSDEDPLTSVATITSGSQSITKQVVTLVYLPIVAVQTTSSTATPAPGESVSFTTSVTNNGHATAVNLVIIEAVPDTVQFQQCTQVSAGASVMYRHIAGGVWDNSSTAPVVAIRWTLPSLVPQARASITYQVVVP